MHLITTHIQANFDALASMLAVKKLHPNARLVLPGVQERNVRQYLYSGALDRYTFYAPNDINLTKTSTLSIVCTRNPSRLGQLTPYLNNKELHLNIYDHHPKVTGDIEGNNEFFKEYGATTTLLIELLQQQKILITAEEATTFALGIYESTGSLSRPTTTVEDLHAAAWLLEQNAQLETVSHYLQREMTSVQIEILHELLNTAQKYTIQDIPIVILTWTGEEYIDDFPRIVDRFMAMENLNCVCALISMADRLYLIVRSNIEELDAGKIARKFGGNGHPTAASATIREITLLQAEEKLIHTLHHHIHPTPIALEMMSSPAIIIPLQSSIAQAHKILVRYNITAAPVVSDGETLGIISRQTIERASHHHLEHRPVGDYMSSDFATLDITATLADVHEIIVNNRQRIIPIIEEKSGEMAGIITRTDLLNRLVNDPGRLSKNLHHESTKDIFSRQHHNLSGIIAETLSKEMVLLLKTIGELAEKKRYTTYAVGGFVRDLLLKKPNLDLDIVVEGDGIAFAQSLARHTGGRCRTHERFKTAVVLLPEKISATLQGNNGEKNFKIDVATTRLEYYEAPAAMPTVEHSSIKLDLSRRDFTINAMAIHLAPHRFGQLIDYFHSQQDLKKRTIRILHNLSFVEDPSRIFRAIRLEKRMKFQISPHTRRLMRNAVHMNLFGKGDDVRFFSELKIILSEKDPLPALERLGQFNLYQFLWPDLQPHYRVDRRYRHALLQAQQALAWYRLLFPEETCNNWIVYLLTIMSRSPEEVLENFCIRFAVSDKVKEFLLTQKRLVKKNLEFLHRNTTLKNSEIVTTLHEIANEGLLYMMAIARKRHITRAISFYITQLLEITPLLTGKDLIDMGYQPGPQFQKILNFLLMAKLDQEVKTKEDELAAVRKNFPLP